MTPEDKAKALWELIQNSPGYEQAVIAQALREAERDRFKIALPDPIRGEMRLRAVSSPSQVVPVILATDIWDGEKWLHDIDPLNPPTLSA